MNDAIKSHNAFGCVKRTIRLRSGRYFDFEDPQPDQFTLGDIAGALSKICRFGGQVEHFYSVAQHCVYCSQVAENDGQPIEVQRSALLHDAAEAFCGDVVKPLKVMLGNYADIEASVESVIFAKYGVSWFATEDAVREIDHAMLIHERRQLFSPDNVTWFGENEVRKLDFPIKAWTPSETEYKFILRARMLDVSPIEA